MTKDFKQSEASISSGQYGLSWVLGGVAVGLLAGAIVYAMLSQQQGVGGLLNLSGQNAPAASAETQQSAAENANTTEVSSPSLQDQPVEDERPGFSYHAVLPQLEVDMPAIPATQEVAPGDSQVIPQVEESLLRAQQQARQNPQPTQQTQQPAQQTQQVTAAGRYMFQLGAYRNRNQALQMQQRARQNGMNTRVEAANVNGQIWYRVRLGPTGDLNVVNRWKQRLSGMGINPMMIRL